MEYHVADGNFERGSILNDKSKIFTVAVEGNIGSGKSTVIDYFGNFENVEVHKEPLNKWTDIQGHNTLDLMYQNPKRWSFTFESYVLLTIVQNHTRQQVAPIKMIERSIYSVKYCFIENLHKQNLMLDVDFAVISELFQFLSKQKNVGVDVFMYIQTRPETCFQRITQRDRPEEAGMSLETLKALHELHEDWLITQKTFLPIAPVLTFNGDKEISALIADVGKRLDEIGFVFS